MPKNFEVSRETESLGVCVCVVVSVFVSNEKKPKTATTKKISPFKNAIPSEPKLAYEKKESEFFSEL